MNRRQPPRFDPHSRLRQTVKAGAAGRGLGCVIGHHLAPIGLRRGKAYPDFDPEWIDKRRAGPKLVLFTVRAYSGPAFWNACEEM
jgi:hypothetical protein